MKFQAANRLFACGRVVCYGVLWLAVVALFADAPLYGQGHGKYDDILKKTSQMSPEQLAAVLATMPPETISAVAAQLTPPQLAVLAKRLNPVQLGILRKHLNPAQLKVISMSNQGGAAARLRDQGGKPVKMYINMKTMDIKTMTAKQENEYQNRLNQAIEAGQSPFQSGSRYLNGVMELVRIPAGSFLMGSAPSEADRMADEDRHEVQLTKDYWMGSFEVTQEQWRIVMKGKDKTNVIRRPEAGTIEVPALVRGDAYPMYNVSHEEALQFCRELTLMLRRRAVKAPKGSYILPENMEFSLPTEAQWEYACRGGSQSAFSSGEILLARDANYHIGRMKHEVMEKSGDNKSGQGGSKTSVRVVEQDYTPVLKKVGTCNPNDFGLYDMHGSVWEWCKGAYYTYPAKVEVDPQGMRSGKIGVTRGGCWYSFAKDCRAARRQDIDRLTRQDNIGFRVVITVKRY